LARAARALRQTFRPVVYLPFRQDPSARARDSTQSGFNGANVLVRTSVSPAIAARAIRAAAEQADREVTVEEFATLNVMLRFQRDNMDLEHAELGNHAAAAPIFAAIACSPATSRRATRCRRAGHRAATRVTLDRLVMRSVSYGCSIQACHEGPRRRLA
jgi:hypothetical protein